jgi:CBS domain containing-hemolysin-like protein
MDYLTWIGIFVCIIHSAIFSGCNLAFFSLGRLRLEAEAERGNHAAERVLNLRQDANLLLCTILWGNVSVNVLLALLSESALNGVYGFLFSTIGITFFGEIMPQAYFSRNALRVGSLLSPVIRFYQILLYPITKPCAILLDGWIGPEGPTFFEERDIEIILERHIDEANSEISANEGQGALNFLDLDDRKIVEEGNEVEPETIYQFPSKLDLTILPSLESDEGKSFVDSLKKHYHRWAVIINEAGDPVIVMDTTKFLCDLHVEGEETDVYAQCHRPIVVTDEETHLDSVLGEFVVEAEDSHDHVVDRDVVLYWTADHKRIITGADIFGRLLKGIAKRIPAPPSPTSS